MRQLGQAGRQRRRRLEHLLHLQHRPRPRRQQQHRCQLLRSQMQGRAEAPPVAAGDRQRFPPDAWPRTRCTTGLCWQPQRLSLNCEETSSKCVRRTSAGQTGAGAAMQHVGSPCSSRVNPFLGRAYTDQAQQTRREERILFLGSLSSPRATKPLVETNDAGNKTAIRQCLHMKGHCDLVWQMLHHSCCCFVFEVCLPATELATQKALAS